MREKEFKSFPYGIVDNVEDVKEGASSDSKNWLTMGDKIELRKGSFLYGADADGEVNGLHTGFKYDGTEILFKACGVKLYYYTGTDWSEIGTDLLYDEEISFANYITRAGAQVWINSPNGKLIKIMTANPSNYVDMTDSALNYLGQMRIRDNRMLVWKKVGNETTLFHSFFDSFSYSSETSEVLGTGDGGTKVFSGTLAFKAGNAKNTCFDVVITDGTEIFTDDYMGNLTGSAGGTGTINYTTGAYSIIFNANVSNLQDVTADYGHENSNTDGISDFGYSTPRVAGEGDALAQGSGGEIKTVLSYDESDYCFHRNNTWRFTVDTDDTTVTNKIYREGIGIESSRGAVPTGDGIYFMDNANIDNPKLRLLALDYSSSKVIPLEKSDQIKLENYRFDKASLYEWGNFILIACRTKDVSHNDTVILYNRLWKSFDKLDWSVNCFTIYGGKLLIGESNSNNVLEVFSGWDDNTWDIDNYWDDHFRILDYKGMKRVKCLLIEGEISVDQSISVYLDLDNSGFIYCGVIEGSGSYVDRGSTRTIIGSDVIGENTIGGETSSIEAYSFLRELKINVKFRKAKIRFKATGLGYASVDNFSYRDIRLKGLKIPKKYK